MDWWAYLFWGVAQLLSMALLEMLRLWRLELFSGGAKAKEGRRIFLISLVGKATEKAKMMLKRTAWKPHKKLCFLLPMFFCYDTSGVGWDANVHCFCTHAWCCATVMFIARGCIVDAMACLGWDDHVHCFFAHMLDVTPLWCYATVMLLARRCMVDATACLGWDDHVHCFCSHAWCYTTVMLLARRCMVDAAAWTWLWWPVECDRSKAQEPLSAAKKLRNILRWPGFQEYTSNFRNHTT